MLGDAPDGLSDTAHMKAARMVTSQVGRAGAKALTDTVRCLAM